MPPTAAPVSLFPVGPGPDALEPDECGPEEEIWDLSREPALFVDQLVGEVRSGMVRALALVATDRDGNALRVFCEPHRLEADLFPRTPDFTAAALDWLRGSGGVRSPTGVVVQVLRDVLEGCRDGSLGRFCVALTRVDRVAAQFVCQPAVPTALSAFPAEESLRVERVAGDVFGMLDAVLAQHYPILGALETLGEGMVVRVLRARGPYAPRTGPVL